MLKVAMTSSGTTFAPGFQNARENELFESGSVSMHHCHSNLEQATFSPIKWYCHPCQFPFDHIAAARASGSSGTRSERSEVSSVDTTLIIDDLLGIVAQVYDQMETGMDDNTI